MLNWSPKAVKSWENVRNSEKLTIGMDSVDVKSIMGEPYTRLNDKKNQLTFFYQPPAFASDGIFVIFDSSGQVGSIIYFE